MPTVEGVRKHTQKPDRLLDERYEQSNSAYYFETHASIVLKHDLAPVVMLVQQNPTREQDDDIVFLTREQFLRVAEQLREH